MRSRYAPIVMFLTFGLAAGLASAMPAAERSGSAGSAIPTDSDPSVRAAMPAASARPVPLVFRIPGDSVLIRFGAYRQWIRLTGVPSPDTTFLSPDHDLILASRIDSVLVPRSVGCTAVQFVRDADTLSVVFFFETKSAHDLQKYQSLLHRYSRFGCTPPRASVAFDDRPAHDPDAEGLRARLPIDSIAGSGGDLSRMRNLLHWVHSRIRWDGTKDNPTAATLGESVEACVQRGLTMNCGGLAETYAAVCRGAGLTARRVVCLPFDRQDPDCHSVAIVYSDSLRRWVYMDPTFETYWTDARGNMLDLERARALLAEGDTVLVNPEANLNGERRDPAEHLAYMSKNLFRFKMWPGFRRTLILNPCDYEEAAPDSSDRSTAALGAPIVTDDPALFWALPSGHASR